MRLVLLGQSLIEHDLRTSPYPGYQQLRARLGAADVARDPTAFATREGTFLHDAPPAVLDCLRDLGTNLLSLANNHAYDLGPEGIRATIAEVRARGFAHAGTGVEAAAASPGYLPLERGTVALVAFVSRSPVAGFATDEHPGVNHLCVDEAGRIDDTDLTRVIGAIALASRTADLVIAYHHDHAWAPDWHATPDWKRAFARQCVEAGAHAFVSHGVPLLHGIEIHRGRPIFYGLGNFIFQTRTPVGRYESAVWESVLADCVFRDGVLAALRLEPLTLNEAGETGDAFLATRGRPSPANAESGRRILERVEGLSASLSTRMTVGAGSAEVQLP